MSLTRGWEEQKQALKRQVRTPKGSPEYCGTFVGKVQLATGALRYLSTVAYDILSTTD